MSSIQISNNSKISEQTWSCAIEKPDWETGVSVAKEKFDEIRRLVPKHLQANAGVFNKYVRPLFFATFESYREEMTTLKGLEKFTGVLVLPNTLNHATKVGNKALRCLACFFAAVFDLVTLVPRLILLPFAMSNDKANRALLKEKILEISKEAGKHAINPDYFANGGWIVKEVFPDSADHTQYN